MDLNQREERRDNEARTSDEHRSEFERDRDRLIYSVAFRRLAGVTQVVDPAEGSIFHNRLTHTLKVAQLARSIAERFQSNYSKDVLTQCGGLDTHVAEVAALAHDIGHPPFGHVAERELNRLVIRAGLLDGYEGNAQSLRILTKLEGRRVDVKALNLTRGTLNAVLKYPRMQERLSVEGPSTDQRFVAKHNKWGAYWTEKEIFDWVRQYIHTDRTEMRSLEAEIMDWADDIAFSLHDVEDFYRAGLFPADPFGRYSDQKRQAFISTVMKRLQGKSDAPSQDELGQAVNNLSALLPLAEPYDGKDFQRKLTTTAISELTTQFIKGITLNDSAATNTSLRFVELSPQIRAQMYVLKELVWMYVIDRSPMATQQYGKQQIIRGLFSVFMQVLKAMRTKDKNGHYKDEHKHILPEDWEEKRKDIVEDLQKSIAASGLTDATLQRAADARLTADFISGLNDAEAISMYGRFTGFRSGSVMDKLYG